MHEWKKCQGKEGVAMKFQKMHGLGNDFVIIDAREKPVSLSERKIVEISDRRRGVGCDLVTVIGPSEKADVCVKFFNADGSESGVCGNATRCIADIVMSDLDKESCTIEVNDGVLPCRQVEGLLIEVDMGVPKSVEDMDMSYDSVSNPVAVDMGNPHLVFFVDNLEDINVEMLGAHFEHHEAFPNRTNVEFVQVIDAENLRQKTWERGCGITQACGSGACAVMVSAPRRGIVGHKVAVEMDGGILHMELRESDGHVLMSGPVAYVFDGILNI
ncbi:MAG: diaminopimelate epimerase [Alphaproteobacteria bacterium]|nr:diaminopimelate epimerase [Alphaproteobacteria bacterium]